MKPEERFTETTAFFEEHAVGSALSMDQIADLNRHSPAERIRRASLQIEQHRRAMRDLAAIRREAAREAIEHGITQADLARELGLSRMAVSRLARPE